MYLWLAMCIKKVLQALDALHLQLASSALRLFESQCVVATLTMLALALAFSALLGATNVSAVRLNEVVALGSHNSFHVQPDEALTSAIDALCAPLSPVAPCF